MMEERSDDIIVGLEYGASDEPSGELVRHPVAELEPIWCGEVQ